MVYTADPLKSPLPGCQWWWQGLKSCKHHHNRTEPSSALTITTTRGPKKHTGLWGASPRAMPCPVTHGDKADLIWRPPWPVLFTRWHPEIGWKKEKWQFALFPGGDTTGPMWSSLASPESLKLCLLKEVWGQSFRLQPWWISNSVPTPFHGKC